MSGTVDTITDLIALAICVELIAATVGVVYIANVYLHSDRRSRIFRMLVRSDVIKLIAGGWIGALAIFRLVNDGVRLPMWTTPISALVVAALLAPPIFHAVTFWRLRQASGDGTPPPLGDS